MHSDDRPHEKCELVFSISQFFPIGTKSDDCLLLIFSIFMARPPYHSLAGAREREGSALQGGGARGKWKGNIGIRAKRLPARAPDFPYSPFLFSACPAGYCSFALVYGSLKYFN